MQTPSNQADSTDAPLLPPQLRDGILLTASLALFVGLLATVGNLGMIVVFIILANLILIPWRLFRSILYPHERKLHLARICIWLATIGIIFLVHSIRDGIHRRNAEEILARVDAYTAQHGHCPAGIEDMGMSKAEFREKLGHPAFYHCEGNEPFFIYSSSLVMFDHWVYDFQQRSWHFRPD